MKIKSLFVLFVFITNSFCFSQIGINTNIPKTTLDIEKNQNVSIPDGLLIPRFDVTDLETKDSSYGVDQNGALIYVNSKLTGQTSKTSEVNQPGFYFYDNANSQWKPLGGYTGVEPVAIWVKDESGKKVMLSVGSNGESRPAGTEFVSLDNGAVGIGTSQPNINAMLDINSLNKGVLIPRMSTEERGAISAPIANGLIIYNTSQDCLNYYSGNANQWLSLCGSYPPAEYSLLYCSPSPLGVNGTYKEGNLLNEQLNTYTIRINVSSIGKYEILVRTTNGYSFYKSGIFTQTGAYDVVLMGQGTPLKAGVDTVEVFFNGIKVNSIACTSIPVDSNNTELVLDCAGIQKFGTYIKGQQVNSSHYITVPISSITTAGPVNITTSTVNGLTFSSGTINDITGYTTIKLYASGTPTNTDAGTVPNFSFEVPTGNGNCSFGIAVTSNLGTFNNPATSCQKIYEEYTAGGGAVPSDGDYWIGTSSANQYKTKCDMVDATEAAAYDKEIGGYTLLWTTSERTTTVERWWENTGYMSLLNGWGRNVVTTETGVVNVNDFRINSSERSRWNGKKTRLVVTDSPANFNVALSTYFNIIESNIISGENWNGSTYYDKVMMQGKYMGQLANVKKNATGDRTTITVKGAEIIGNAYHYGNTNYPFHYDLTTYGYYPEGTFPDVSYTYLLDGNWPFWVGGEWEGPGGTEPFGYCTQSPIQSSSQYQFWGNKQVSPTRTAFQCYYNNTNVAPHPGVNGSEGKVMQWWAK